MCMLPRSLPHRQALHYNESFMDRTKDYKMALLVGLASGVLWFFVLQRLALAEDERIGALVALPIIFPVAVWFARRFFGGTGKGSHAFRKAARFLMVGILNTGIDFFVFNILMAATGLEVGLPVTLFKSVSFFCALFNSYELNRRWTFDGEGEDVRTAKEFARFAAVTGVGFLVNVGTTSLIVIAAHPAFGLSQARWDNVAAAAATALSLAWNFVGYKWFVFTNVKSDHSLPDVI